MINLMTLLGLRNTKTSRELQNNINSSMKSFSEFTNPTYEGVKLDLPKVISEGSKMSKGDLFKRQNRSGFLQKAEDGVLLDKDGNELKIKDKDLWSELSSELQSAGDEKDLTLWTPKNFKQVFGTTLGNVLKGGNGFSPINQANPTGEDWEAGIAVGLQKLGKGIDYNSPEWLRFDKYWTDWEESAMKTAIDFKNKLGISELKQTGSMKVGGLTKEWKGTNTTPKTDLMDKSGKIRVSLKKSGGSQLMSAGKAEAISTVEAAMRQYGNSSSGQKEAQKLVKELEEKMIKLSHKGAVGDLEQLKGKDKLSREEEDKLAELDIGHNYAQELNQRLEKTFNGNDELKKLFCYEAATGHAKFGRDTWPTATMIATFYEGGGLSHVQNLRDPLKHGGALASGNDFYVSFKSSGKSSPYLSLRSKKAKKKLKVESLSDIIHNECGNSNLFLTEEVENLTESQLINKLMKMSKEFSSKVANAAKKILNEITKRIQNAFNWIKKQGAKIWNAILYFFGFQISDVRVKGGGVYPL
jgi:hypothetical protein